MEPFSVQEKLSKAITITLLLGIVQSKIQDRFQYHKLIYIQLTKLPKRIWGSIEKSMKTSDSHLNILFTSAWSLVTEQATLTCICDKMHFVHLQTQKQMQHALPFYHQNFTLSILQPCKAFRLFYPVNSRLLHVTSNPYTYICSEVTCIVDANDRHQNGNTILGNLWESTIAFPKFINELLMSCMGDLTVR